MSDMWDYGTLYDLCQCIPFYDSETLSSISIKKIEGKRGRVRRKVLQNIHAFIVTIVILPEYVESVEQDQTGQIATAKNIVRNLNKALYQEILYILLLLS